MDIEKLLNERSDAIGMKDIERLMSLYARDIVYFDLVPPLQYSGALALRNRFLDWFDRWESAIGQELSHLNIVVSGDVAAAHMLIRASGTLKMGREVNYWVRVSNICQRSNQKWSLTHEHVSLPVDLKSGQVVMDLVP